jgi:hypothetical protein
MRNWGFNGLFKRHPEHSMAYGEILSMEGKFKGNAGAKAMFMPFEFLELKSAKRGVKDIWIYPPALRDREVKNFLLKLYEKRPDIFPDYAVEYMRSEKPL